MAELDTPSAAPAPLRIERVADLPQLGSAVAAAVIERCRERQAEGGIPCVVLTGGSGGERVLRDLAAHPELETVDWSHVRFLWGDERWAPQGHEDRNDRLADDTLFARVRVDPALVHRVPASDSGLSLDEAAAAYAEVVANIDRIDVGLNGVGPDGHVASLFPGRDDLLRAEADTPDAIAVRNSPKPPPERVSLTFPALNRAEHVWLIAAGAGKSEAVGRIVSRSEPLLPAAHLIGTVETALWADEAALGAA
ncbi:MAG: 6-phosphogluconolactonase [Leucobacter sp.]